MFQLKHLFEKPSFSCISVDPKECQNTYHKGNSRSSAQDPKLQTADNVDAAAASRTDTSVIQDSSHKMVLLVGQRLSTTKLYARHI